MLRVRLIAPLPYRTGAAMEQLAITREAALEHVRRKAGAVGPAGAANSPLLRSPGRGRFPAGRVTALESER